jgi:hypothetical protein
MRHHQQKMLHAIPKWKGAKLWSGQAGGAEFTDTFEVEMNFNQEATDQ